MQTIARVYKGKNSGTIVDYIGVFARKLQVAREMLSVLKREKLVLDWRKRQQSRAAVQLAIEMWLDKLPTAYEADLWQGKVQQVYSHVYDNYYGNGRSIYTSLSFAA